jgi:stage V sporulation protein AD
LSSNTSYIGVYGACSTMALSLAVGSFLVSGGFKNNVISATSSHFCSSELQYRFPLEYGGQRTPTSQWTVTGSGAALVSSEGDGPVIESATIGTVTDLGIKDANNMGAAMAPSAMETIRAHFDDLSTAVEDYDLIVTGDLGSVGKELLLELARNEGIELAGKLADCGTMVFDNTTQDVHAGGSGCGCSAITLCSELLNRLNNGNLRRILFCGTGALLSPTSTQQSLPIPGICHAVSIRTGRF